MDVSVDLQTAIRNVVPENEFERFCLNTWAAGRTPGSLWRRNSVLEMFTRLVCEFCRIERAQRIGILVVGGNSVFTGHARRQIEYDLGVFKNKYVKIFPLIDGRGCPSVIFVYDSYYAIESHRPIMSPLIQLTTIPVICFDKDIATYTRCPSTFIGPPNPAHFRAYASGFDIWENYVNLWAFVAIERRACADVGRIVIGFLVT